MTEENKIKVGGHNDREFRTAMYYDLLENGELEELEAMAALVLAERENERLNQKVFDRGSVQWVAGSPTQH